MFLLVFFSCHSLDKDEYKILNLAISKYVFKELDPKAISDTATKYKVSGLEAISIIDSYRKNEKYTFTMSDTLVPVNISKDNWDALRQTYVFNEIENRSDKAVPIDFSKVEYPENLKKVTKAVKNENYVGHYTFHRVLFDKSRERAYIQIDLPKDQVRFGTVGLRLKKKNVNWEFEK
ncbi:hypothetical protein [Chryseobacterium jejuense]|uniref:hypothetical protein n=1 Tax=Chryseobacterium jejuense TaxID=445960 RepID=UPI001AEA1AFA|nr:hypothetical protein [Chryseobacterium jejuense]MBP2616430.1 hypothetical protein [Chryseobacterium jejuense]